MTEGGIQSFTPLGPPVDTSLPFFAYGIFKKDEIAWGRIQSEVSASTPLQLSGFSLKLRNGIAIAIPNVGGFVNGIIHHPSSTRMYKEVGVTEPQSQYKWREIVHPTFGRLNLLEGRSPDTDSTDEFYQDWHGFKDPAFRIGFPYAYHVVKKSSHKLEPLVLLEDNSISWHLFFELQSGYLLMWSFLERFQRFAFGESPAIGDGMRRVAESLEFQQCLENTRISELRVYDSRRPKSRYSMTQSGDRTKDSIKALDAWYALRSNVAHRGKDLLGDHKLVVAANEMAEVLKDFFPRVIQGLDREWQRTGFIAQSEIGD